MNAWLPCSVLVVTEDPSVVLPEFLRSLSEAGQWPEAVIVVDNAPTGRPRPAIEPGLPVTWLRNPRPQAAGRSLNQALALARARLNGADPHLSSVIIAQPDLWLAPDAASRLMERLASEQRLGFVGPKILRAHVAGSLDGEQRELDLTDVYESAGLRPGFLGRLHAVGANEKDTGQYDSSALFPSAACVAVRWAALERLSMSGPWVPERGSQTELVNGLIRRLTAVGETGALVPDARTWRLAARPVSE